MEIWKSIAGYEGYYEISSCGRVRSVERCVLKVGGCIERRKSHIMSTCIKRDGYAYISLTKNKITKSRRIHRLVAETLIPNPHCLEAVDHVNGIKTDNRVENLEWCTRAENTSRAFKLGLTDKKGTKHHNHKLTDCDVIHIRDLYGRGKYNQYELADKFNISVTQICNIVNNKIWKHIKL